MISSKTWVIASPTDETYEGFLIEEIPKEYNRMAFEEFDKQFEEVPNPEMNDVLINFCTRNGYTELTRTLIKPELLTWHGKPVKATFFSCIYTKDGYPWGEAVNITNSTEDITIARDLTNFYKSFNWNARLGVLSEVNPENRPLKELDDILLKKLFALCSKKYL